MAGDPKALENAEAALAQLAAFLAEPVTSDRDRAGVIQAFAFTFEATWKLLKHVAERIFEAVRARYADALADAVGLARATLARA